MTSTTDAPTAEPHVTVVAPINIAFIKYWGKREGGEHLILPTNDSFSITLSTEPFRSTTSVVLTSRVEHDILWLNGKMVEVAKNNRLVNVLATVRATCPLERAKLKAFVVSNNNFPTCCRYTALEPWVKGVSPRGSERRLRQS